MKIATQIKSLLLCALTLIATSAFAQWSYNGNNSWGLISTNGSMDAVGNQLGSFGLTVTNPSTGVNTINASAVSWDGTQGSASGSALTGQSYMNVIGYGGGAGTAGANGPNINFNSNTGGTAIINGAGYFAGSLQDPFSSSGPAYTLGPGGVISVISNGSSSPNSSFNSPSSAETLPTPTYSGGNGGDVSVVVTGGFLNVSGSSSATATNVPWQPNASAITAGSYGGTAAALLPLGLASFHAAVGNGGNGGAVTVNNNDNITIGSLNTPIDGQFNGITAVSTGAAAATCCTYQANSGVSGYQLIPSYYTNQQVSLWTATNGNGGDVNVSNAGSINSWGGGTIGIVAASIGGAPEINPLISMTPISQVHNYNEAQPSGVGGNVSVTNSGNMSLLGQQSFGIFGVSTGQQMAIPQGWIVLGSTLPAGNVAIQNTGSITVGAAGSRGKLVSSGILALSSPGWMTAPLTSIANALTTAGTGGNVQVTNSGAISAHGTSSYGISALSIGNSGILSNRSTASSIYYMGNGATTNSVTSNGGSAIVTNTGAITVDGQGTAGIVAMANGDGGLISNLADPVLSSSVTTNHTTHIQTAPLVGGTMVGNNTGTFTANGGTTTVSNAGSITTGIVGGGGETAIGILAQSIGGGGGNVGGSHAVAGIGDTGGAGGVGGSVSVNNTGNLLTRNDGSLGILTQSIGGGGGNGAAGAGGFVAVGGAGGSGGSGGSITLTNGASNSPSQGFLTTLGDFSSGVVAQSIGGGGGNGGYSKGYGIFASVGLGGSGGSGGSGGLVNFANYQNITTSGDQSHSALLQSIGGGGGIGGAASSYSVGVIFASSVAVGGVGGLGGVGGSVGTSATPILNAGNIGTSGNDSFGILMQSIGGGGGNAGSALAKTLAMSFVTEPAIPTIAFSTAIGGKGGGGGTGGGIYFNNTGAIQTTGSNAFALGAQSIGGGGGNGSDASAGSNVYGNSKYTLNSSIGLGGGGGVAGDGGQITINNDGTIATYGNNASSLLAQSIGGGGGTSGSGNAKETKVTTGEKSLNLALGIGGSGGAGGQGGDVNISNSNFLQTIGSSSSGVVVQTIGGGGGVAATAGTQGISNGFTASVALGGSGGAGGNGGAIAITNTGNISTGALLSNGSNNPLAIGGDSHGIVVQSIAGGGGMAGSSDPTANLISNPYAAASQGLQAYATYHGLAEFFYSPSVATFPKDYEATVGIGGNGGGAGNPGGVTLTNSGVINTLGHRSFGILAQAIGGGGGYGASVMSGSSAVGSSVSGGVGLGALSGLTFNSAVNVGGSGGASSTGGNVSITQTGVITTAGYGSYGVLAQSIGGGGGYGADGSIAANTGFTGNATWNDGASGGFRLALGSVGTSPSIGSGGTVTYDNYNNGNLSSAVITTYGDNAVGILAQSIGGGGGVASGGCTNNGLTSGASACLASTVTAAGSSTTPANFINQGQSMALVINPSTSSLTNPSNGGAVNINSSDTINVNGSGSIGISAQSIGGGGGLILADKANILSATLPAMGSSSGIGGAVGVSAYGNILLNKGAEGAVGVLAQSIGGGGGYLGDPKVFDARSVRSYSSPSIAIGANSAAGGFVSAEVIGNISMYGPNQIGVLAQSIGGGGGIASVNGSTTAQNAAAGAGTVAGTGGAIKFFVDGSIIDYGHQGGTVGIFAQSSGNAQGGNQGAIVISLSEPIYAGGSWRSAVIKADTGIILSGGGNSSANANEIINGNILEVPYGHKAIIAKDGYTWVYNSGTISGGIDIGPTPGVSGSGGAISNYGTINATGDIKTSNDSFKNYGKVYVAGSGIIGETDMYGSYKHFSTGTTYFDVNTTLGSNDFVKIVADGVSAGTMLQGGSFQMNRIDSNKLPTKGASYLILTAQGGYLASADGVNATPISISDTSPLVTWGLQQNGNNLSAQYQGLNASPAGYAFNKSQQNFLNYVINGYNAGDAGVGYALGSLVSNGAAANLYGALSTLNGAAQTIQSQTIVMTGNAMLGNALSCPTFEQNGTIYGETECVWGKFNGGQMRQAYSDSNVGYRVNDSTLSLGAQLRIASDTFFGASARYGQTNSSSTNFGATANVGDVSLGIKKIVGDYYLGISGAVGVASQSNNRYTTDFFTGQGYNMTSHSNAYYGGVRARNAYQFNLPRNTYIKPYLDLDGLWIHTPSYQENGSAQGVPLQYNTQNSFNFMASPMVEVGGRINLESKKDAWIRPFVSAGAMFITNNTTNIAASIVGANSGTYQISTQAPSALFNANVGIQVFSGEKVDVKLEYSAQAGQGFIGQTGTAKVNYRF